MQRSLPLIAVFCLYGVVSLVGIDWGLPSRSIDPYLFGFEKPWSGQRIYDLSRAADKVDPHRGADVDADALEGGDGPVLLNATPEDVADIYLRYRLYTHQPDEMITMMALAQMSPRRFDLDPQLYQYGGLFIYPVGALIQAGGVLGLIEVRTDLVYYLDHPEAFSRFYIAARLYVAAWGGLGVLAIFWIARRLEGRAPALVAAMMATLLPIMVCMSHEAKPHLPGAALMLFAVLFAMRYLESEKRRDWLAMAGLCGASLGMVLSSLPIFVLIPLAELLRVYEDRTPLVRAVLRAAAGAGVAVVVYAVTNPYVPVNLFLNPEVLRSNLGNSVAMYEISRVAEGGARMLALLVEGATLPVVVLGALGVIGWIRRGDRRAMLLLAPALLFFIQFMLIGAGKPAEYGRFGLFLDVTLGVAAAGVVAQPWPRLRGGWSVLPLCLVVLWVALFGFSYLRNLLLDPTAAGTRIVAARTLAHSSAPIAVSSEPAPYAIPPVDFAVRPVWLFESEARWAEGLSQEDGELAADYPRVFVGPTDDPDAQWPWTTPISWANKPIRVRSAGESTLPQSGR